MKKQPAKGAAAPSSSSQAPTLAVEPAGGWPPDEFTGLAGRYVRDPVTGIRRPADAPATEQPPEA